MRVTILTFSLFFPKNYLLPMLFFSVLTMQHRCLSSVCLLCGSRSRHSPFLIILFLMTLFKSYSSLTFECAVKEPLDFPTAVYNFPNHFLWLGWFQQKIRSVNVLAYAAITKYHIPKALSNKYLFLTVLESGSIRMGGQHGQGLVRALSQLVDSLLFLSNLTRLRESSCLFVSLYGH